MAESKATASLGGLPDVLLSRILRFSDMQSLVSARATNRALKKKVDKKLRRHCRKVARRFPIEESLGLKTFIRYDVKLQDDWSQQFLDLETLLETETSRLPSFPELRHVGEAAATRLRDNLEDGYAYIQDRAPQYMNRGQRTLWEYRFEVQCFRPVGVDFAKALVEDSHKDLLMMDYVRRSCDDRRYQQFVNRNRVLFLLADPTSFRYSCWKYYLLDNSSDTTEADGCTQALMFRLRDTDQEIQLCRRWSECSF